MTKHYDSWSEYSGTDSGRRKPPSPSRKRKPERYYGYDSNKDGRHLKVWPRVVIITALLGSVGVGGVALAKQRGFEKVKQKIEIAFKHNDRPPKSPSPSPQPRSTLTVNPDGSREYSAIGGGHVQPTAVSPESTPTPNTTPQSPEHQLSRSYMIGEEVVRTIEDENGQLPYDVKLSSGDEITFDGDEMKALRDQALQSHEPVIVAIYPVEKQVLYISEAQPNTDPREHPVLQDLPPDFITDTEELKQRGVEVIQGNDALLFVRQSAFSEGGVFHHLQLDGHQIRIVLVEGPYVSASFLQGSQYDDVRSILSQEVNDKVDQYRAKLITDYKQSLDELRADLARVRAGDIQEGDEEPELYLDLIKTFLSAIYGLEHGLVGDDELLLQMNETNYAGLYHQGFRGEPSTIFVAVGAKNTPPSYKEYVYIGYSETGQLEVEGYGTMRVGSRLKLRSTDAQPNPGTFERTDLNAPHSMIYPYGGQMPGFALHHEIKHDWLIRHGWWPVYAEDGKTIIDWEKKLVGDSQISLPNYSEYDTDEAAMYEIQKAWKKWQESGFTDNSGYQFAFQLPEGGYILTDNREIRDSESEQMASNTSAPNPDWRKLRHQSDL